jgi:hypothetical protein
MKPYPSLRTAAILLAAIATSALPQLSAEDSVNSGPTTASRATLGSPIHTPEQVHAAAQEFHATNEKLGKPRYLIAVTHEQISGQQKPTVADLNRKRDVEKLVQQLFANGGATLVDPNVGVPLLGSKPYQRIPAADNARSKKDRAAIGQVADVVVEITILARHIKVLSPSSEQVLIVPDVTAEAYRVSDSALLGAGSTHDVIKERKLPEDTVMTINMEARTETTIVALMEDMKRNLH